MNLRPVRGGNPSRLGPAVVAGIVALCGACSGDSDDAGRAGGAVVGEVGGSLEAVSEGPIFAERAAAVGLEFTHFNGMSGEYYYSEHMGGGSGLFDYDLDGDLDLYVTQGHLLGPGKSASDAVFPMPEEPIIDRLYRNDLVSPEGSGELRFTDVTEESGIVAGGYGMGVAVGDIDNDGWPDLYVTNWGSPNQLWRNNGDSTFSEVTKRAGVGETRWSIAAAFLDYDRDGWLDLFISNYLDYTISIHKECVDDIGLRDYCGPVSYDPVTDVLMRNRGDGTFEDATAALVGAGAGSGFGIVTGDFDGNGWLDIYVTNDELANHLWLNQGDGTFRNEALMAGAAVNAQGQAEASMGVDAGDFDRDGDEDLIMVHINQETNTIYENLGGGAFEDRSFATKIGAASWEYTGFGTGFLDYDHDGWLDLFVANGAVQAIRDLLAAGDPYALRQKNQLFHNRSGVAFAEVSDQAGEAFALSEVSRGAAFGDIDNDGDVDIVVHNNSGPLRLLINEVGHRRPWLGLRLVGETVSRDMLGAWVEAVLADGTILGRRVRTEGSYASAHDPRVVFGLGDMADIEKLRVTWPDGAVESFAPAARGSYTTLRQGSVTPAGTSAGISAGTSAGTSDSGGRR
ncbi:MAG: CRTAC1 family protein [bacterium]|nr:CRTAC1 family protein [bacterium]